MSKNKTIKTILLLVLFLIVCCIMTKSYALNVTANTPYESIVNALNERISGYKLSVCSQKSIYFL